VRIDGKMLCESTPCEKVVDEGDREIIVQKDLYSTKKQIVTVQRGKSIQIKLEPNFGWLEIESKYDGINVVLDGKNIGKTPIQKRQITPGAHLIEPQGECFNTVPEQFVAEKGRTHTINLGVQQKEAAIQVTAKDDKGNDLEADVFVDGKNVGAAPGKFKIPMCSKEVVVRKEGYEDFRKPLYLDEKMEISINPIIKPQKNSISEMELAGSRDFNRKHDYSVKGIEYSESGKRADDVKYKKTRPLVKVGVTFVVVSALSLGGALISNYLISLQNDDAKKYYDPENTASAKEYLDGANDSKLARNILYGTSAGFFALSIPMFFITKEQPVAVYVDDKGFMLSYNFKF
jgi:hypothetical protein